MIKLLIKMWTWIKSLFERQPKSKRRALLFAINNYPGEANDLNGCLNDQMDVRAKLLELWPDFNITTYSDDQATVQAFLIALKREIADLTEGDTLLVHYSGHGTQVYDVNGDEDDQYDEALYLYDGALIDDKINEQLQLIPQGATVVLAMDCCFSGDITRGVNDVVHNRFHQMLPKHRKEVRTGGGIGWKNDMNWILLSGCSENQTSADAYINDRFNGAFTFYALRTLRKGISYWDWYTGINKYLPSDSFSQAPTLEGPDELINRAVFE